ncbi:methyl-accepting chemotaxis protein [Aeromicrobium terrae]|uniref:Choice-of-anchor G family protein n=1 Tax=Aeromicrobium terrae TaxID=2498846 RepID=A0A5C8NNX7_9ACTN|nr:hypothetical protein [Aeromicrobium terrae]TXL62886.1 hypothetical protein FHP06_01180 [Aeromicrobium terrae]
MRSRRIGLAATGVAALVAAGFLAPGAFAKGTIDGDVAVSNTETVQVLMDASGKIDAQRVYDQLVLTGNGSVDIANPVSTKGLRNLDGFGGFDVRDGAVRVKSDVSGTKKFRSVSDFTEKLPLKIDVTYTLDGKTVGPGDVVGKSGTLDVRYRVTNVTGVQKDVPFDDGLGHEKTAQEDVVVPMVGSLTTVLPSTFTKVRSAEANAAGDGRGGTKLSFTMTLIPPIGSDTAEFGYTAHVKDGVVPKASLSALPVDPLQSPSFKGGAASYKSGAETGQDLTAGATEIDANVLKIRDGAADLVAGLIQLRDGASQLNAGLSGEAAPGARKLADGAGQLDAGAKKLSGGTGDLSDGLDKAAAGGPALLKGVADLKAGAAKVDAGLKTLNDQVVAGIDQFKSQFAGSADGAMAQVSAGIGQIIAGYLDGALTATANTVADPVAKGTLLAQIAAAKTALQGVQSQLTGAVAGGLKAGVNAGLDQLAGKITAGVGTPSLPDTLRNGMAQLIGGLSQLQSKGGELADGLEQLSSGAKQLDAGAGDLAAGTGQLSGGAGDLAEGLGAAASGSGRLADGLDQAAGKAPELPKGADRLSKEGTSQLVGKGDETAQDYGLKYALLEAGAERAGNAQPYGSPEGATALTAYTFEIAGADGADTANLKRGLAALAVLAACAGLAGVRRAMA